MRVSRYHLANHLRAAADMYERDSVAAGTAYGIREQFKRQAADTRKMADAIEDADTVEIGE